MPEPDSSQPETSKKTDQAAHEMRHSRPVAFRGPLTLRVVLLSLFLVPLNAWWLVEIEYVRYSDNATTQALFFNATSILLILIALNAAFKRLRPGWIFTTQELVALYVVVCVASNLAGHDQLQILFTTLTYVFRHDTPESQWGQKIIPNLPAHLVVRDPAAVNALYTGHSTLYRPDHILPWLGPIAWWTLFVMLIVWVMLCLTALFRRQWDAERLAYPIAEIPIQMVTQKHALFRAPVFWGGFVLGGLGQIVNMVHSLFPAFPSLPIGVQIFQFDTYPWNAMGAIPISSFPFAYGLAFLLPTQLGFSCWFFFLFSRVEMVVAATQGYTEWGKFPYIQQQGVGACFGLFVITVWAARSHLKRVWRAAWRGPQSDVDDSDEPFSSRTTVFGLMGGIAGLVWFAVAAGMRIDSALIYLALLFMIVIVTARLRAELGLPTFELYQVGAEQVMQRVAGTNYWSRNDLTVISLLFFLTRTHRQFPMQNQVDALRLGRRTATPMRSLAVVILLASAFGTVCAFWALLHSTYAVGYESAKFQGPAMWAFGAEPWKKLDSWMATPQKPDGGAMGAYVVGTGVTLFLAWMRSEFLWWPFHPAGYLVSGSFGLFRLWLPIFVSWLFKTLLLRYGGLRAFRRALPFFLGLVLGEFAAGFVRTLLDLIFGLHLPASSGIGGL